jgi:hypothetical protein
VRISAKTEASIILFAALYYVLSIFSLYIPAIGLPQITISLTAFIASVFGILLGAELGAFTAFVGALVAWILPPGSGSVTGLPFLLSPPLNALTSGLIYTRRWKEAAGILALLIGVFWFSPPCTPFNPYWYVGLAATWDKIIACVLIAPTVLLFRKSSLKAMFVAFFLLGFIGNQADNSWGNLAFAFPVVYNGIFGLSVEAVRILFVVSPFIYPVIRIIQGVLVAVVAAPLVKALKGAGWMPLRGKPAEKAPVPAIRVPVYEMVRRNYFAEAMTYVMLATISIVGVLVQTWWWLFPGCAFILLAIIVAIEYRYKRPVQR